MKWLSSSRLDRLSKPKYLGTLAAALLVATLIFGVFSSAPSAHGAVSLRAAPTSVHTPSQPTFSQFRGKESSVQVQTLTLPPASCAALQKAHPGATCQILLSSTLTMQPFHAQGKLATTIPATWYYWNIDTSTCSDLGCSVWSLHLQANGILNYGISIWQYNVFCNQGGIATCTWHGYFGNGSSVIQVGLDGQACLGVNPISICSSHGIRESVNDVGTVVSHYSW